MATAKQLWAFSISSDEKEAVTGVSAPFVHCTGCSAASPVSWLLLQHHTSFESGGLEYQQTSSLLLACRCKRSGTH